MNESHNKHTHYEIIDYDFSRRRLLLNVYYELLRQDGYMVILEIGRGLIYQILLITAICHEA